MPSIQFRRASATLLPLLCLLISLCAPQAVAQDLPQRTTVQRSLDALGKSETLTVSQQADQRFLTDTLALLDNIEKEQAKAKTLAQRVRTLPGELKEISAKLDALALNDTNKLELRVFGNDAFHHAVLIARLDNLGKGASGAAVQNLQLMLGL